MQRPLTQPGDIGLSTQLLKGLRQAQPGLQNKFKASPKSSARPNWTKKKGGGKKEKDGNGLERESLPISPESSSGGLGVWSGRIYIYAPQQDGKCLQCIQLLPPSTDSSITPKRNPPTAVTQYAPPTCFLSLGLSSDQ